MNDINELCKKLENWAEPISLGIECPDAAQCLRDAAAALRATQDEDDIVNKIKPEDIEWVMDWSKRTGEPDEIIFETEKALAHLLMNDVVFLNSYWWKYYDMGKYNKETKRFDTPLENPTWTKDESRAISVSVNCNDIFAWGCADAEDLPFKEIENLYRMWKADPNWGPAKWCAIQRNQKPQKPVIDSMKKSGSWDAVMESLESNTMQAEVDAFMVRLKGS